MGLEGDLCGKMVEMGCLNKMGSEKVVGGSKLGSEKVVRGCPMDIDGRSTQKFEFLFEKISVKISSWKFLCLSQVGKLILINSIIVALASHVMALYLIPKTVLKEISSLFTKFWWATSLERKPIYWRARSLLEKHTTEGGLYMKNIEKLNIALMGKQAWRIHYNPQILVSKVVTGKYGASPIAKSRAQSQLGRVSWSFRSMVRASSNLGEGVGMRVGDGKFIDIERDAWVQGAKVKKKEGADPHLRWVADLLTSEGQWNPPKVWDSFDGHTARRILAIHVTKECKEDELEWIGSTNGIYSVKSGYAFLLGKNLERRVNPSFWKTFWKMKIMPTWK